MRPGILIAMDLGDLLDRLWADYAAITPQAREIHRLLKNAGETIVNDHIALRTFAGERLGIDVVAAPFVAAGYRPAGVYRFAEKKLDARHYDPPDPGLPRLFISELRVRDCSPALQAIVADLIAQVPAKWQPFVTLGRPWFPVHIATVRRLRDESEYAAWLAAHGIRANHFTVLQNALRTLPTLEAVVGFLQTNGFALNAAGGIIKGSPGQLLEQCSTLADTVNIRFTDGSYTVPGCYYEFARRYPDASGALFGGFIEGSADKIFESTDRR